MSNMICTRKCWNAGAGLGALVFLLTAIGPLRWFEGVFLGLITTGISGPALIWLLCGGKPALRFEDWHVPARPSMAPPAAPVTARMAARAPQLAPAPAKAQPAPAVAQEKPAEKPAPVTEPDDLRQIRGIGPKAEELLQEHGISRLSQIAAFGDDDLDRLSAALGRVGARMRSDDWVGQAQALIAAQPAGGKG